MLKFPGDLEADTFLGRHWQKEPLFIPGALGHIRPAVSRNELAWLATLDDVESRIVLTDRTGDRLRYRVENGPFDDEFLAALPKRDWTLLVHDVEKHLPAMRSLFRHVAFIPDWRIDDLMVSFAAPGGGVGPHRDNYDVFLCQGIGERDWRITTEEPGPDANASDDLALLNEFAGARHTARQGDVLYLPPGVAHWGTAKRACMTYSIGMRAPELADLATTLPDVHDHTAFYADPDLATDEAAPGYISPLAVDRALALLSDERITRDAAAKSLGCCVTMTKQWLTPESATPAEAERMLHRVRSGGRLDVHGMARIAFDADRVFVNGRCRSLANGAAPMVAEICRARQLRGPLTDDDRLIGTLRWMVEIGAFELSGKI